VTLGVSAPTVTMQAPFATLVASGGGGGSSGVWRYRYRLRG
jgi:hypothetical protein